MKAVCTFKNEASRIGLKKDQDYEIIFVESLQSRRVIVDTTLGRLAYDNWAGFYQDWQVNATIDATATLDH